MFKIGSGSRLGKTLIEDETSVFKEEEELVVKNVKKKAKKEKLPIVKPSKRKVKSLGTRLFYGFMFLTALASLFLTLYNVKIIGFGSSIIVMILAVYGCFFTEPSRWRGKHVKLSFWNASVTVLVLVKSLHPNIYAWRNILLWTTSVGMFIAVFWSEAVLGVLLAVLLALGMLFFADRNFEWYKKITLVLSFASIISLLFQLLITQEISLGIALVGLILYQVYERVSDLEIEAPSEN